MYFGIVVVFRVRGVGIFFVIGGIGRVLRVIVVFRGVSIFRLGGGGGGIVSLRFLEEIGDM